MAGHLPKHKQRFIDLKLAKAFNDPDPDAGLAAAKALARSLADAHPDPAASLREGLEQMFTVRRLGVSDRLARSLSCTNAIESMISIARDVKRWQDGKMVKRWMAAGIIQAERRFRRIKGCADMPTLVAAIRRAGGRPHHRCRTRVRHSTRRIDTRIVTELQHETGHPLTAREPR
ncbi:hypothetical protein BH24ACT15_BH24ACT15_36180 [soil metagenome]